MFLKLLLVEEFFGEVQNHLAVLTITDFGFPILVNYPFFMRHFMKESFTEKQNRTIKFYKMLILICIFLIQRKMEESSTI